MTEETTEGSNNNSGASEPGVFSQEQVNSLLAEQKRKVQAQYVDYGDLKAKAARLDEIETATASELEKAVKKARAEGAAEVQSAANARLIAAEVRALAAAARFHNPTAAARLLDLSDVTVSDSGDVDSAALKSKLAALAKDEPYLVDDGKVRPKVDPSQGGQQGPVGKAEEGRAQALKRFGPKAGLQQ